MRSALSRFRRGPIRAALLVLAVSALSACDQWMTRPVRYRSVALEVKRRNGEPVPGTELMLYTGARPMGFGKTDANGKLQFDDVPFGSYGLYILNTPAGYFTRPGYGQQYIDGITVDTAQIPTKQFVVYKSGQGTILVRTVDANGVAIPRIQYRATDEIGGQLAGLTDSLGLSLFTVGTGIWTVRVDNPAAISVPGAPATLASSAFLVEGGTRDTALFRMTRCTGEVNVRVLDSASVGVAAFPVALYVANGVLETRSTTAAGTLTFAGQNCGSYGVILNAKTGWTFTEGRGSSYFDGIAVTPTLPGPTFTFRVRRVP